MNSIKDYIASQLNEEQTKAALHINTSSLILAGAGSWKTRTLIYKIAYLIFGNDVNINRILAVTFTNKAAKEMKERLIKINWDIEKLVELSHNPSPIPVNTSLGEGNLGWNDDICSFLDSMQKSWIQNKSKQKIRLNSFNINWIGTFHGMFLKILKEEVENLDMKLNKNFTILDTNESQSALKDVLKRLKLDEVLKVNEVKWFISKLKNEWMEPSYFAKKANSSYEERMLNVYQEYQKSLEISNLMDFDDLLLYPYILFKKKPEVLAKRQNKFDYIMVDEAQDTNWIQFELMRMMSWKNGNITLIGDDYQSIYGRRGALMENFLNVKKYWADIQMFKLQINYRSKPHIVNAWSHIIKNNLSQYEKNIKPHRDWNEKIVLFTHVDETDEAINIVDFIKKLKWTKIDARSDVAILYRTNAQSSIFEQMFIQERIPYKIFWAFKFFERLEIKDITAYMKYLLNPLDNISLKRILNVPNRKIWKTSQEAVQEYAIVHNISLWEAIKNIENIKVDISSMAKNWIIAFNKIINEINSEIQNLPTRQVGLVPSEVIEKVLKLTHYKDYLIKEEWLEKAEEKYENIWQLINMAWKYGNGSLKEDWTIGESWWIEVLRQLLEEITLLSDISEDEKWVVDAVKLMTVHSSKWLEFNMVFIAWLEDNIFPLSGAMMDPKTLEEERRLMYVAITRAKDHLFLSYAWSRMQRWQTKYNPPSRFIAEIQPELLKSYNLWWWASKQKTIDLDEWDIVKHKLFGIWKVMEIWTNIAVVKFNTYWLKKIEIRLLEKLGS